jgi:hypothetical protein
MVTAQDNEIFVARRAPTKIDADHSRTQADHLIACVPASEVRRNAEGSIDIAFYKERAQRLRREATLRLCRSIREFTRAWFWNVRKSASERPRRLLKIALTQHCCKEENYDA